MSGWFALFSSRRPSSPTLETELAQSLAFRGPDGIRSWRSDGVVLTEALLLVQRRGADPLLPAECGNLVIVGDVRLDARDDLIASLQRGGSPVTTDTGDAALILHAYQNWGTACVQYVAGDFSFVIYDSKANSIFCARDRLGVKPFYYAQVPGGLILSNTLACIKRHPEVSAELDEYSVGDFLAFADNWYHDRTFFNQIKRLPPAHRLVAHTDSVCTERYWEMPIPVPIRFRSDEECVERFKSVLKLAVQDRIPSDRVGVLMSGGLDSTLLAALARDAMLQQSGCADVRAVCGYFSHLIPDNEKHYAEIAASHLGIPTEFVEVDRDLDLYQEWDSKSLPLPEPVENPLDLVRHRLYRAAARQARVALTGFDGDSLLFLNHAEHFRRRLRKLEFVKFAQDVLGYSRLMRRPPPVGLRTAWQRLTHPNRFPPWIRQDFADRVGLRERWLTRTAASRVPEIERGDSYAAITAPMWVPLFESHDAGVTGLTLDFYHPLADLRVVTITLELPPIPWCLGKRLIRRAACGILPAEVLDRRKTTLGGDPVRAAAATSMRGEGQYSTIKQYVAPERLPSLGGREGSLWESRLLLIPQTLENWIRRTREN